MSKAEVFTDDKSAGFQGLELPHKNVFGCLSVASVKRDDHGGVRLKLGKQRHLFFWGA